MARLNVLLQMCIPLSNLQGCSPYAKSVLSTNARQRQPRDRVVQGGITLVCSGWDHLSLTAFVKTQGGTYALSRLSVPVCI